MTEPEDAAYEIAIHLAEHALEAMLDEGDIAANTDGEETAATWLASLYMAGLEAGMRVALTTTRSRARQLLDAIVPRGNDLPPLELHEKDVRATVDDILGVARVSNDACPDCYSHEILYEEELMHLVCGGCGQLLRPEDD